MDADISINTDKVKIIASIVKISNLNPKDEFKIGNEVFIVLEQTDNGTRVIAK